MDTNPNQHNESDTPAGDLLVGAEAIEAYLRELGVPDPDAYYLRRFNRWPIGKYGALLIGSKRRFNRHADKITRGPVTAGNSSNAA